MQLRHHLFGEQLRVVLGQIFAHVAELQQHHQVADVEVLRDLAQLGGDLVGRADDDIAALDDRVDLARQHLEF
jgi:hypothetical protein